MLEGALSGGHFAGARTDGFARAQCVDLLHNHTTTYSHTQKGMSEDLHPTREENRTAIALRHCHHENKTISGGKAVVFQARTVSALVSESVSMRVTGLASPKCDTASSTPYRITGPIVRPITDEQTSQHSDQKCPLPAN